MTTSGTDACVREIIELAGRLHARTHAHYEAKVAETGLTMPQARALMLLSAGEAMSMRALSDLLGANPSNVTITVDRLQGRGLVERDEVVADRRVRAVRLSQEGAQLKRRLEAGLLAGNPTATRLSTTEQETLRDLLRRLVDER
ncbi:MarR family winged helix-turn-helix transcriptional regulator [Nonomuraea sp. 3N208]|uniref:MarR family winged helix-turn-helix transcriptional regulator n=1 Tax=Nonomuraea sp. 3N208 TaxID=3457421 RepID=UPI003FD3A226